MPGPSATERDRLRALAAAARWVLHSALARQETRGMHYRADAPGRDLRFNLTVRTRGLDNVTTETVLTGAAAANGRQAS